MIDLHPYDGKTRVFRDTDVDTDTDTDATTNTRAIAHEIIARRLGLPSVASLETRTLRYCLSYYSGGMGIFDSVQFSLAMAESAARAVAIRRHWLPWAAATDDLRWLLGLDDDDDEDDGSAPEAALRAHVAKCKAPFQAALGALDHVWFDGTSTVNGWTIAYFVDGEFHLSSRESG